MNILLTFIGALLVVGISIAVFLWLGTPVYRLETVNVEKLLTLLLDGEATRNDWEVFAGVPIRHDPHLDEIRQRCCDIVEREAVVSKGKLQLSERGKQQVQWLLLQLSRGGKPE